MRWSVAIDPVTAMRTTELSLRDGTWNEARSGYPVPAAATARAAQRRPRRRRGRAKAPDRLAPRRHRRGAGRDRQWNESPQAQDPVAFGLSIVKPCFSMVSTKSIVAPPR